MVDDDDEMTGKSDVISDYLYSPAVKNVKNPLAYWQSLMDSGNDSTQTAFAQMAIDFLSAPGTYYLY